MCDKEFQARIHQPHISPIQWDKVPRPQLWSLPVATNAKVGEAASRPTQLSAATTRVVAAQRTIEAPLCTMRVCVWGREIGRTGSSAPRGGTPRIRGSTEGGMGGEEVLVRSDGAWLDRVGSPAASGPLLVAARWIVGPSNPGKGQINQ